MRFIFNQLRFSKNNAGHRPSESAVGDLGEAEAAEKDKVKLANLMSLAINFYPAHLQKKKKKKSPLEVWNRRGQACRCCRWWRTVGVGWVEGDGVRGRSGGVLGEQQTAKSQRR